MRRLVSFLVGLADMRDLHVYGGLLLVTCGAWALLGPGALILPGAALFYLGTWR
jgi:hypothetical protein